MNNLCVIFDLDGTLVDSEGLCNQAFLDLLPQLDLPLSELLIRFRGRKMALIVAELEQILGAPLPTDFVLHYREHVRICSRPVSSPCPACSKCSGNFTSRIALLRAAPSPRFAMR